MPAATVRPAVPDYPPAPSAVPQYSSAEALAYGLAAAPYREPVAESAVESIVEPVAELVVDLPPEAVPIDAAPEGPAATAQGLASGSAEWTATEQEQAALTEAILAESAPPGLRLPPAVVSPTTSSAASSSPYAGLVPRSPFADFDSPEPEPGRQPEPEPDPVAPAQTGISVAADPADLTSTGELPTLRSDAELSGMAAQPGFAERFGFVERAAAEAESVALVEPTVGEPVFGEPVFDEAALAEAAPAEAAFAAAAFAEPALDPRPSRRPSRATLRTSSPLNPPGLSNLPSRSSRTSPR